MFIRDDEKVRRTLAANIAYYRRQCNLTQEELAEKIFYSGKSISKWERGDGVPDIYVLVMLAAIFDISVNDLLAEKQKKRRLAQPQFRRNIITLMSIGLVWLAAAVVFFFMRVAAPWVTRAWLAFVIAIPVSFIVGTVFTSIWHSVMLRFLCISGIVWSLAVTLHISLRIRNMFLIYVIAALLQLLIVLWYLLVNTKLFAGFSSRSFLKRSSKTAGQDDGQ